MAISYENKPDINNMSDIDIPQLPIDVIIHIMSYLSVSDRMSASLVNQAWREASLAMKFIDQQAVNFSRPGVDNLEQLLSVLQNSTRPFYHFIFRKIELKRTMTIWEQLGSHMRSLILIRCDLSEKMLVDILKCCDHLKTLHINACRECLMSGLLLDDNNDVKNLSEKLQSLYELSLAYNRYLSDALFNRLVAICPNLESLSLMGCQISFHCGLYKKFYPNSDIIPYASESVLTFLNVLHYVTERAKYLKHLNFGFTLIDGTALATLSALKSLKLESLRLQGCDQLTLLGIKGLTEHQTLLKILDISFCTRVTDASLVSICQNLQMLESLNIRRCRAVTDCGIGHIRLLQHLKELDISECEQLTGACITSGLCCDTLDNTDNNYNEQQTNSDNVNPHDTESVALGRKNIQCRRLENLSANALNLDENSIECIAKNFPKLKQLDIGYCFSAVTDKTVQMIFKDLIFLRKLKMNRCDKVSDAGLTGMGASNHESAKQFRLESVLITEPKLRISLRSRVEEEIVRDAERKREVTKLCEDVSGPLNFRPFSGFSLIRLKGLVELDLSGCNRITDVSLKHAFAFPELKILDLSKCQQITHVGLDYLTRNNTALEILNLSQCHNITDTGISYVAQRLYRLRQLHLRGCSQLTDSSLVSIKQYSKSLRHIDARHCLGITSASVESLSRLDVEYVKQTEETMLLQHMIPSPPSSLMHGYRKMPHIKRSSDDI